MLYHLGVSRSRGKATAKTGAARPATSAAKAPPPRVGALDKFNIFFAVFGVIAVVAGLLSHALVVIVLFGLAYVLTFTGIAIYEKSIKWPAWRVIISLALILGLILIYNTPPRTETFSIDMYNFTAWTFGNHSLSDFPVTANPQTGKQYSNYEIDPGQNINVNARCWISGNLAGYAHVKVLWVSIKGGDYDGLWIPYEAVAMNSPGLANDLPNCNSWWLRVFPFL